MRIQYYRKLKRMTQTELAKTTGVTQAYICTLENGKRQNPSIHLLIRIADVLEVTVDNLMGQDEARKENKAACGN